jgi:hypothetical protein
MKLNMKMKFYSTAAVYYILKYTAQVLIEQDRRIQKLSTVPDSKCVT